MTGDFLCANLQAQLPWRDAMRNMFRAAVIGIVMACAAPVAAGPFEDGLAASERGDYAIPMQDAQEN